jgi:hypothetical protein
VSIDGQIRHISDLLIAASAEPCPKSGIWINAEDVRTYIQATQGSLLPQLNDDNTSWIRVREA